MARGNKNAISPYHRLLTIAKDFAYETKFRETITMFGGMKKDLNYTWDQIYERMMAAEQLGYEVLIKPDSNVNCFRIVYRKKVIEIPYELQ